MSWLDTLRAADAAFFHLVNAGWSNSFFDVLLPLCREKWFWAPFYLFIGAFAWLNFGWQKGWIMMLGLIVSVGLADFSSSSIVKKNVQRLRPCNDPVLREAVILRVGGCGSGYSFTSSHAANHFAAAVFLIGVLGRLARWVRPALLGWASVIALAQVYVGVHFPGDVLGGALLGSVIGQGVRGGWKRLGWLPVWP